MNEKKMSSNKYLSSDSKKSVLRITFMVYQYRTQHAIVNCLPIAIYRALLRKVEQRIQVSERPSECLKMKEREGRLRWYGECVNPNRFPNSIHLFASSPTIFSVRFKKAKKRTPLNSEVGFSMQRNLSLVVFRFVLVVFDGNENYSNTPCLRAHFRRKMNLWIYG